MFRSGSGGTLLVLPLKKSSIFDVFCGIESKLSNRTSAVVMVRAREIESEEENQRRKLNQRRRRIRGERRIGRKGGRRSRKGGIVPFCPEVENRETFFRRTEFFF